MIDIEEQLHAYAQAITADKPMVPVRLDAVYGEADDLPGPSGRGRYLVAAAILFVFLASGVLIARGDDGGEPTLASTTTTIESPDEAELEVVPTTSSSSTTLAAGPDTTPTPVAGDSEAYVPEPLDNDILWDLMEPEHPMDGIIDPTITAPVSDPDEYSPPPGPLADPGTTTYWIEAPATGVVAGDAFLVTIHVSNTSGRPVYVPSQMNSEGCGPFLALIGGQSHGEGCTGWSEIPPGESSRILYLLTREVECHPDVYASSPDAQVCLPDPDAPALPPGETAVYVWVGDLLLPPAYQTMTLS